MKKVMLIDDDATTNFLNKLIIEKSGCFDQIIVNNSAEEAITYLESMESTEDLLILLDVNMPIVNGWEFLEQYKGLSPLPKCHIVMLTSSINPHDRAQAEANPFVSDYRSKPLSIEVIQELVSAYF